MRVISARHRGQPRPSSRSRTRSAQAEQKRWWSHGTSAIRGFRFASRHTSRLSVSVSGGVSDAVPTWLSVWLLVSGTVASSSSLSELSSPSSTAGPSYVQLLNNYYRQLLLGTHRRLQYLLGRRLWIAAQKSVSRIFMSCIFHLCSLVPIFHVPQFHVSHFQRPLMNLSGFGHPLDVSVIFCPIAS